MNKIINSLIESSRRWVRTGKFWYGMLTGYLLVLGFLSLNPWVRPVSTNRVFSPDKLDHALAYGGLSLILYFCINSSRRRHARTTASVWLMALTIATLIGIFVEIAQSRFTYNRSGSVTDAVANAIGATLGYVAYNAVKYIREKMAA